MRKSDLIQAVADRTGVTHANAAAAIDAVIAAIQEAMARGDEVTITGFGSFRVVDRAARGGRNPRTGAAMTIAARRSPVFRPGAGLKHAIGTPNGASVEHSA